MISVWTTSLEFAQGHLGSHRKVNVVQRFDPLFKHNNRTETLAPTGSSVFGWYLGDVNTCGISKQEQVSVPGHLIAAPHLKFVSSVK